MELVRTLASVLKLRIGVAITLCAMAGVAVSPGLAPAPVELAVLAFAVLLSSASAGAFNHYVERDLDARMSRTRLRPFVTGRFKPGPAWLAGIALMLLVAVAAAAAVVNAAAAAHVFLGAFVYGVVYTVWLKRRTWLNIVLGGLAGSFAVLAGAAAVDPALAPAPAVLAVVLFLWTPPHFWSLAFAYRRDYAEARVPMLPVVIGARRAALVILGHTVVLVALSLALALLGMGWIYLAGAAVGGVLFLRTSLDLAREPSTRNAMRNFRASLLQLGLILVAAPLDAWLLGA
ncbi:MAG: heme o synthase [Gammaproteobacteria bacterium]|nr:heme o synthase [Gammaproteobacteria bacterium]